jgi:hypothetical protein
VTFREVCLAYDEPPQEVDCYHLLARSTSRSIRITAICSSSPSPMPPRRSRSKEREPPGGLSLPEEPSNRQFPTSSTMERSGSSHPQASGESTLQHEPEGPVINTSAFCGESTTEPSGQLSRSVSTPKTPQGMPEEQGLMREVTLQT